MKTERRHELQQNYLADRAGHLIEVWRPYLKPILVGFLLAGALLIALIGMRGNRQKMLAQGWEEYMTLSARPTASVPEIIEKMEALREFASRHPGVEPGAWGLQSSGDIALQIGSERLLTDRAEALLLLKQARDDFESSYQLAGTDLLKQRALMGLAQAHESLNEFEQAESTYQRLMKAWPDSALASTATDRLAFLQKPRTKEFYDWFMQQQPKTPDSKSLMEGFESLGLESDALEAPESSADEEATDEEATDEDATVSDMTLDPVDAEPDDGSVLDSPDDADAKP